MKIRILLTLMMTLAAIDAQAALNLSISPLTGGNNLRFGRVSSTEQVSKEVRVRMTSTDGNQYQLFQRMADSFYNEKNVPLDRDAISTYTLLGSNSSGTLYAQNIETLGVTDQLLYSSGSGGESDSFTAVYVVDGHRINASGRFFGRIQYALRPVGGSAQDDVILNVSFETSGDFKVEVEGSSTIDSLRLNYHNDRDKEGYVQIRFEENLGQKIQIYQEVEPFPQDELFNQINDGTILFVASGKTSGELQPRVLTGLTRKRTLIYSSQENEDSFRVNFMLDPNAIEQQKAGTFNGQLKYFVQTEQTEQMFDIQMEVKVEPVFAIEIDLPNEGLNFERLLPNSPPIIREVKVEVKTNLGRPYMVMQNVISPLTNEEGSELPDQYFTFKGELLNEKKGKMAGSDYKQVPRGESSLYVSDNKGSPSQFKVNYRVRPYSAMVPGDYTTSIRYSLGEI